MSVDHCQTSCVCNRSCVSVSDYSYVSGSKSEVMFCNIVCKVSFNVIIKMSVRSRMFIIDCVLVRSRVCVINRVCQCRIIHMSVTTVTSRVCVIDRVCRCRIIRMSVDQSQKPCFVI